MEALKRILILFLLVLAAPMTAGERDQFGRDPAWRGATGSYTLIDFAASWCQPCWKSLPHLVVLAREHPSLRVIVVSVDDRVKGRDLLVERLHLTLPVVWDEKAQIASHYRPEGMPATFIIDPQGKVVYSSVGFSDKGWRALQEFVGKLPAK
jgi:thiol-disulfide isomerase/thioredoxin